MVLALWMYYPVAGKMHLGLQITLHKIITDFNFTKNDFDVSILFYLITILNFCLHFKLCYNLNELYLENDSVKYLIKRSYRSPNNNNLIFFTITIGF